MMYNIQTGALPFYFSAGLRNDGTDEFLLFCIYKDLVSGMNSRWYELELINDKLINPLSTNLLRDEERLKITFLTQK